MQGDLLATLETLPLVAVLRGAIYHLDTVHSVFIVGVQKRVLLCEPIHFDNSDFFLYLVPHVSAKDYRGIISYPLTLYPLSTNDFPDSRDEHGRSTVLPRQLPLRQ